MKYVNSNIESKNSDLHVIFAFEDNLSFSAKHGIKRAALDDITDSCKRGEIEGKAGEVNSFFSRLYEDNYIIAGLGKKKDLSIQIFEKSIKNILGKISSLKLTNILIDLSNITIKNVNLIQAAVIEIEKSLYNYNSNKKSSIKVCSIKTKNNITKADFSKTTLNALAIANGLNTARKLGDTPSNICNPTYLAREAKKLEKKNNKLKVEILNESQMKALKMNSLLSVSQGSDQPAKLVIIKYMPVKDKKPIVLVGKGITFDTGGISLKPASTMDEMKYDMSGAGSVIGTMQACAEMKLKNNVIGILACAENMPSGSATRPGDVYTSMSGIKIEILNTDAEGRLVLCDALTFAKKFKPRYVLDMATLTGACLVGLGKYPSGLFSNDEGLAKKIIKSADKTGDRVWQLPLYKEYFDELKTNFADIQNIGGRYGGAITAAAFLANFTESYKWAHLDIAGTAWETGINKGSTGRPVKLLTDFVMSN